VSVLQGERVVAPGLQNLQGHRMSFVLPPCPTPRATQCETFVGDWTWTLIVYDMVGLSDIC
jgi:hypothetical protein